MEPNNLGGRWDRDEIEDQGEQEGGGVCGCIATILVVVVLAVVVVAVWFLTGP